MCTVQRYGSGKCKRDNGESLRDRYQASGCIWPRTCHQWFHLPQRDQLWNNQCLCCKSKSHSPVRSTDHSPILRKKGLAGSALGITDHQFGSWRRTLLPQHQQCRHFGIWLVFFIGKSIVIADFNGKNANSSRIGSNRNTLPMGVDLYRSSTVPARSPCPRQGPEHAPFQGPSHSMGTILRSYHRAIRLWLRVLSSMLAFR